MDPRRTQPPLVSPMEPFLLPLTNPQSNGHMSAPLSPHSFLRGVLPPLNPRPMQSIPIPMINPEQIGYTSPQMDLSINPHPIPLPMNSTPTNTLLQRPTNPQLDQRTRAPMNPQDNLQQPTRVLHLPDHLRPPPNKMPSVMWK